MPTRKRFTEDAYRKEPWFKNLCQAMLSCRSEEEMANLLRDIGTLSELQAWGERLEVARQLSKGLSYREVARLTGASTTTVTRVAKFIENGPGGYRKVLHVHRHHRLHPTRSEAITAAQERVVEKHTHTDNKQSEPAAATVLQKYLRRK